MGDTKHNRYEPDKPKPVSIDPLLGRLRNLCKAGENMGLRSLQGKHQLNGASIYLLANKYPHLLRVDATPDGKAHFVTLLDPNAPAAVAPEPPEPIAEAALPEALNESESEPVTLSVPAPVGLERVDGQGGHYEMRRLISDPLPGMPTTTKIWVPDSPALDAQTAQAKADAEYERCLAMLRGDTQPGIGARHGGHPTNYRDRPRKPLVDVNTGESLALANAAAARDYSRPITKRLSNRARRALQHKLADSGKATPVRPDPHPMRHKQSINGAGQRREEMSTVQPQPKYDLVLKHHLPQNRVPVSRQIDTVNPIPNPPLRTC